MKKTGLLFLFIGLIACQDAKKETIQTSTEIAWNELQSKAQSLFGKLPEEVEWEENQLTDEMVELGQSLYFDLVLLNNQPESCVKCHNLDALGIGKLNFSPEVGRGRKSADEFNLALHIAQFWNGRGLSFKTQGTTADIHPQEMGFETEEEALNLLKSTERYPPLFASAFPEEENAMKWRNLTQAIAAFESKLLIPSRFDDYLAGDDQALTEDEKKGLQTFIEQGCVECHKGNALGGGLDVVPTVDGKLIKAPGLRNVSNTFAFFHDGSVRDVKEAICVMSEERLHKKLSPEMVDEIALFFQSLSGD